MSDKVVGRIGPVILPGEVNQDLVDMLEKALADARAGTLVGVGMATVRTAVGGSALRVGAEWSGNNCRNETGFAISLLQHEFLNRTLEQFRQ